MNLEELWLKIFGESEDVYIERYDTIYTHMTVRIVYYLPCHYYFIFTMNVFRELNVS